MKPTGLGHVRVKSPDTACARVDASSIEGPGRPATAVCQGGVLSGIVVGGSESQPQGEGHDGSMQPAQETRAGQVGSDCSGPLVRMWGQAQLPPAGAAVPVRRRFLLRLPLS